MASSTSSKSDPHVLVGVEVAGHRGAGGEVEVVDPVPQPQVDAGVAVLLRGPGDQVVGPGTSPATQ